MSTKISQLTSAVDVTANDLIQIVDVEDGVMAPSGTNKKATASLLANQLVPLINAGAIAGSKIADSGITSAKIANDTIINADINSSAAIAGTKVFPDFGSQNIITTGTISANAGSVISGSSSGDALRITQTGAGNALVVEDSTNPDSTPLAVNSEGQIFIGATSGESLYNIYTQGVLSPKVQVLGSSLDPSSIGIFQSQNGAASGGLFFAKSRYPNAAVLGDSLGVISYQAYDGSNYFEGARITAVVDQAIGTGDVSAGLSFATNPTGTSFGTSERIRITSSGNVGIGTNTPSYQLQLSTDSAAKPSTSTWTVSSDERLKENIEAADLDICYNAVKSIPLKRYKWKDEIYSEEQVSDRSKIGWIAQDVQEVFPKAVGQHKFVYNQIKDENGNIVSEESIDDCLSLNSDQLYAAMFGAVQKLMITVEELQDKVVQLESGS